MENKNFHLIFLAQVLKKTLLREFYKWLIKSKLKSKVLETYNSLANRKREEILRNPIRKLSSGTNFTTIIESKQERTPSPPVNIFEELKSSLNSKVNKIDQPFIKQHLKSTQISGVHRSDTITDKSNILKKAFTTNQAKSTPTIKKVNSANVSKNIIDKSKTSLNCSNKQIIKK